MNANRIPPIRPRGSDLALALAFVAFALILRLYDLGKLSFWFDETVTYSKAQLDLALLWSSGSTDNKPPLYYTLLKPFLAAGTSEFHLRLLSALVGSLSVGVSYYLGRELAGRRGALLLALLMAVSDVNLQYSQEARHYMLLTLALMLATLGLVRFSKRLELSEDRFHVGALFTGEAMLIFSGTSLALYTHPIALHYLFSLFLATLVYGCLLRRFRLTCVFLGLIGLASLIVWLPWFRVFLNLMLHGDPRFEWLEQVSFSQALDMLLDTAGVRFVWQLESIFKTGLFLLALSGITLLGLKKQYGEALLLAAGLLLTPFLIWATGYVKPIFIFRTIMPVHFFAAAAVAVALSAIPKPSLRLGVSTLVVLLLAKSVYGYYQAFSKAQWREASAYLAQHVSVDNLLVLCNQNEYRGVHYYYPNLDRVRVAAIVDGTLVKIDSASTRQRLESTMAGAVPFAYPPLDRDTLRNMSAVFVFDHRCQGLDLAAILSHHDLMPLATPETAPFEGIKIHKFTVAHSQPNDATSQKRPLYPDSSQGAFHRGKTLTKLKP